MTQFMLLMHDDTEVAEDGDLWGRYLARLRESGRFDGGSSLGGGTAFRSPGPPGARSDHLAGYLVVSAANLEDAATFLDGNPTYEAGGTVEIRELLAD